MDRHYLMAADSCRAAKHFRSSENEARLPVFVTYSIITLLGQKSANNVFTADPPPVFSILASAYHAQLRLISMHMDSFTCLNVVWPTACRLTKLSFVTTGSNKNRPSVEHRLVAFSF